MFSAVFAFRFVVLVAATNNGREGSVPILKVIALSVGYPDRSSAHLVGTGPLEKAARPNQLCALFLSAALYTYPTFDQQDAREAERG